MKTNKLLFFLTIVMGVVLCTLFFGQDAFASEGAHGWRPTYDLVMKYVNFFILAFIVVKYGKTPLMNFLHGKKDEIAREIELVEEQKKIADEKSKETLALIEKGDEHIAKIKQRITKKGEQKKQEIIESAKKQSILMIEKSKKKIEHQIQMEKEKFKSELIDSAINIAMEKLPGEITDADNQILFDNFLAHNLSE